MYTIICLSTSCTESFTIHNTAILIFSDSHTFLVGKCFAFPTALSFSYCSFFSSIFLSPCLPSASYLDNKRGIFLILWWCSQKTRMTLRNIRSLRKKKNTQSCHWLNLRSLQFTSTTLSTLLPRLVLVAWNDVVIVYVEMRWLSHCWVKNERPAFCTGRNWHRHSRYCSLGDAKTDLLLDFAVCVETGTDLLIA